MPPSVAPTIWPKMAISSRCGAASPVFTPPFPNRRYCTDPHDAGAPNEKPPRPLPSAGEFAVYVGGFQVTVQTRSDFRSARLCAAPNPEMDRQRSDSLSSFPIFCRLSHADFAAAGCDCRAGWWLLLLGMSVARDARHFALFARPTLCANPGAGVAVSSRGRLSSPVRAALRPTGLASPLKPSRQLFSPACSLLRGSARLPRAAK